MQKASRNRGISDNKALFELQENLKGGSARRRLALKMRCFSSKNCRIKVQSAKKNPPPAVKISQTLGFSSGNATTALPTVAELLHVHVREYTYMYIPYMYQ